MIGPEFSSEIFIFLLLMRCLSFLVVFVLCIAVVSGKQSWDVQCYYSDSCDAACYNMCEDECSGFYAVDWSNCYDYGDNDVRVDCYCKLSGIGYSTVIILPTLFVCWCCVAMVVGMVICHKSLAHKFESASLLNSELTEDNYVIYSAFPSFCTRLGGTFLIFVTCGLCLPFVVVKLLNKFFTRFWFGGEQGEFHGRPLSYCLHVFCMNNILACFTCGCWVCCGCADQRQAKWIDQHTTVVGRTGADQNVFLFQARPAWYKVLFTRFCSCITCGIAAPLFFVRNLKETVSQMKFGRKEARFVGETDDYVDTTWAPICGLNMLTCGCYSCCGLADARTRNYIDKNIKPTDDSSRAISSGADAHSSHDSLPSMASPSQYNKPLLQDTYQAQSYNSPPSGISLEKHDSPPAYPQMQSQGSAYGTYQKPF